MNETMPKRIVLGDVPKIGWGQINGRGPTDYSLPGCLGNIACYIDAHENRTDDNPLMIENRTLDRMNQLFMTVTGIAFATLWSDDFDAMVNELHRINDFGTIVDRCMRLIGRGYTIGTPADAPEAGWKAAIMDSIAKGRPVLMDFAAGIPEFSIITGYDDDGDTLIGWAYCVECVRETEPNGMFRARVDWTKPFGRIVIVGDYNDASLSDGDIIAYAIETMERETSQDTSYKEFTAGFPALRKWHDAMADTTNNLLDFGHFLHLMILNVAEPRAYFLGYAKEMAERYAGNPELKSHFESMVDSSVKINDYARAMWRVKDNPELEAAEKRNRWCGLIRDCIEGDGELLGNMRGIVKLLEG